MDTTITTKIYVLLDKDNIIRYVGKTVKPLDTRLSEHVYTLRVEGNNHRTNWMRECLSSGYRPTIQLLEEVEGDGCQEEIYWIKFFRDAGLNLVNSTNGGEGMLGYYPSAETRAKMGAAHKGSTLSAESRAKVSIARKGKKKSLETRAKMSLAQMGNKRNLGRRLSDETKAKISQSEKATKQAMRGQNAKAGLDQIYQSW